MSGGERETGERNALSAAIDTVTPPYVGRRDVEMDVIGWGYFLAILILLVPLLPFIVILWLADRVVRTVRRGRRAS